MTYVVILFLVGTVLALTAMLYANINTGSFVEYIENVQQSLVQSGNLINAFDYKALLYDCYKKKIPHKDAFFHIVKRHGHDVGKITRNND